jgi:hypothetical protein
MPMLRSRRKNDFEYYWTPEEKTMTPKFTLENQYRKGEKVWVILKNDKYHCCTRDFERAAKLLEEFKNRAGQTDDTKVIRERLRISHAKRAVEARKFV